MSSQGSEYDYFAKATKTWLVTKGGHLAAAAASIAITGVLVTSPTWVLILVPMTLCSHMWKAELQNQ